jgi:hypothetical protein
MSTYSHGRIACCLFNNACDTMDIMGIGLWALWAL